MDLFYIIFGATPSFGGLEILILLGLLALVVDAEIRGRRQKGHGKGKVTGKNLRKD